MYKLRELENKDLALINSWRNDPELIRQLGAPFRYINPRVDEEWFEHYMATRSKNVRCAIVNETDDVLYGLVSLTNIDALNRSAELHLMIGEGRTRGKGIGTFAVGEILHHAFYNLNLRRIELTCVETNSISPRLYVKFGFKKEGVKRKAVYKEGKYIDLHIYSLLKDEYVE